MANFFSNFEVVVTEPEDLPPPRRDVHATKDKLGGYLLEVNRGSGYFRDIFGEQCRFTKHERQQLKLFAIEAFLTRCHEARQEFLPEVTDKREVRRALMKLAEAAIERGEL